MNERGTLSAYGIWNWSGREQESCETRSRGVWSCLIGFASFGMRSLRVARIVCPFWCWPPYQVMLVLKPTVEVHAQA